MIRVLGTVLAFLLAASPIMAQPARMDAPPTDASGGTAPSMRAAEPETDRRPLYLGVGVLVLAAVFLWNRSRRDRFDREDRRADRRDDDADALHRAANDEDPT